MRDRARELQILASLVNATGPRARERLQAELVAVGEWLPQIHAVAESWAARWLQLADLVQAGVVGLLEAASRYDLAKGEKGWPTYAHKWIERRIAELAQATRSPVREARHEQRQRQARGEPRRRPGWAPLDIPPPGGGAPVLTWAIEPGPGPEEQAAQREEPAACDRDPGAIRELGLPVAHAMARNPAGRALLVDLAEGRRTVAQVRRRWRALVKRRMRDTNRRGAQARRQAQQEKDRAERAELVSALERSGRRRSPAQERAQVRVKRTRRRLQAAMARELAAAGVLMPTPGKQAG